MSRSMIRAAQLLVVLIGPTFALSGTAQAETAAETAGECHLTGRATNLTEECRALRVSLRDEVDDCMQALKVKAEAQPGEGYTHTSQTNRSRLLICDLEVRKRMGLAD